MAAAGSADEVASDRLRRALAAAIGAGRWPPGARLPSERELMITHRVSRFTVRQALRRLEADGAIRLRRWRAYVVPAPAAAITVAVAVEPLPPRPAVIDPLAELLAHPGNHGYRLETLRLVRDATTGSCLLELTASHDLNGEPRLREHQSIRCDLLPAALSADFSRCSPSRWLADRGAECVAGTGTPPAQLWFMSGRIVARGRVEDFNG